MRVLLTLLALALPVSLCACVSLDHERSMASSASTIEERFDAVLECLRSSQAASTELDGEFGDDDDEDERSQGSGQSRWSLSSAQRTVLRRCGVRIQEVPSEHELFALATLLEFGESLTPDERETVARLSLEPRCRAFAFGLARIFVERGPLDVAAKLMIAGVVELKRPERGRSCWKWWFTNFSTRPAFPRLNRDIAYAFLRVAETGDATAKEVVADLFNERELTPGAIARIRKLADSIRQ